MLPLGEPLASCWLYGGGGALGPQRLLCGMFQYKLGDLVMAEPRHPCPRGHRKHPHLGQCEAFCWSGMSRQSTRYWRVIRKGLQMLWELSMLIWKVYGRSKLGCCLACYCQKCFGHGRGRIGTESTAVVCIPFSASFTYSCVSIRARG